jgi:hypothetical protein
MKEVRYDMRLLGGSYRRSVVSTLRPQLSPDGCSTSYHTPVRDVYT